jgi:hypothetical protein
MKITIEHYDNKYICETLDDVSATDFLDLMCRFMVVMTYPPQSVENAIVNKYNEIPNKD